MAVSHADLAPSPRGSELGSKTGAFLTVFSVLLGLCCFILCLIAETTRSQMRWVDGSVEREDGDRFECIYNDSGKTPLLCGAVAFAALAIAMVVEHGYILVAVTKSNPPPMAVLDHESGPAKALTWQAGIFFATTWVCFATAEILLLIGLSIESGHLTNWSTPRASCLVIQRGLFSSGGAFGITTVFLACGLYITALRAQKLLQDQEIVHREILEDSTLYASPPRSLATITNENSIERHNQNELELFEYLSVLDKVF